MTDSEITVWIPTCNRPALLENALSSVLQQTNRESVREVIVVENGLNRDSEEVCATFSDLPITYVFRDPPLAPGSSASIEATIRLLEKAETPFIAILFDDDWWSSTHLERALQGLLDIPGSVASYCPWIYSTGETGYLTEVYGSFVPWVAASGRYTEGRLVLSFTDLIVVGLLNVSFHFSSMVVRTDVFLACQKAVNHGNPYDTDRLISVELGRHGSVLCDPVPTVFVRMHPGQESARIERSGAAVQWWQNSTKQILNMARIHNIDLPKEFEARMRATSISMTQLRNYTHIDSMDDLCRANIMRRGGDSLVKRLIRSTIPPAVWNLGKRIHYSRANIRKAKS